MMAAELFPTEIKLQQKSRLLEIVFSNGRTFRLPYEFLRVPGGDVGALSREARGGGRQP